MRLLAMVASGVVLMLVAATQVPSHLRLPVSAVVLGGKVTQPFGCTSLLLEPFDRDCPTHTSTPASTWRRHLGRRSTPRPRAE